MPSVSSRPNNGAAGKGNTPQASQRHSNATSDLRQAAAASLDELVAKEALANLKRARTTARIAPTKSQARLQLPPATIVVRPARSHAWRAPFVSLAVIVGISILLSAGGIAYLSVRPLATDVTSDAELRKIRDSLAQLRRTVADLSNEAATSRAAIDAAAKAASDHLGRNAQFPDRAGRDQSTQTARIERVAEDKVQVTLPKAADAPTEITGSVAPPQRPTNARRDVIADWRVRRAYDGVAILEGPSGVVEVNLGQDVPGLGRIQDIKYDAGRWQVVTNKGTILAVR